MHSRRRVSAIIGVLLLLLGCGGTVFYVLTRFYDVPAASMQAEAAAAAYRRAGLPWEAKDLAPNPPVKGSENASPLLRKAIDAFDRMRFNGEKLHLAGAMDAGRVAEVEKEISRFDKALDLAVKATLRPFVDFHRDWDYGVTVIFREYEPTKNLAQALCLRAQVRASHRDSSRAASDLRSALRLAILIGQDPTMIGMLVRISCERIVLDAAQRCAAMLFEYPEGITKIAKAIEVPSQPDFRRALRGEAYIGLASIRNLAFFAENLERNQHQESPHPAARVGLRRTGVPAELLARAYATRYFQVWIEFQAQIDRDPGDSEHLGQELDAITGKLNNRPGFSNTLADILLLDYGSAGLAIKVCEADRLVTNALLIGLIQRARTGRYPTNIEQIHGTWNDPFSSTPLLMKLHGNAIRIYSVGPNRKDNGGVSLRELTGDAKKDYDIVAAYPPIKHHM